MRISDFLDDVFDEQRRLLLRQKESPRILTKLGNRPNMFTRSDFSPLITKFSTAFLASFSLILASSAGGIPFVAVFFGGAVDGDAGTGAAFSCVFSLGLLAASFFASAICFNAASIR